jgi:integrase
LALNLYRRHRRECVAHRPEDSRSGEFEERQKGWKRCDCPIFASGVLARRFKRRQTGRFTWDEAKAVVADWERADSWDGPQPISEQTTSRSNPQNGAGITVERAVEAYLAEHKKHSSENTVRKYILLMAKLKGYSATKGFISLDRWTPNDVREFRDSWTVAPRTAAKDMAVFKAFFTWCLSNEWIKKSPAALVKPPRGRSSSEGRDSQKLPFTDEELQRMYQACETKYGKQEVKWSRVIHNERIEGEYARYNYKWTGQDLADFISVSTYTGLRISDICTFRIDRLRDSGECHIRTTKTGVKVYTWIPEWLQERVKARAKQHGPLIFGTHTTKDSNVVTDVWRRKLIKLWSLCGPWTEKPTPHRFRHTFARILLQRPGVSVRDVAELLGDTEDVVRRHYAAWVQERQDRLTAVLRDAFSERPKPNVIEMPGRAGTEGK